MKLTVKSLDRDSFEVEIDETEKVEVLREKVQEHSSISPERQRIIYRGRLLKDGDTLSTYSLSDGQTIHLVARPEGAINTAASGSGGSPSRPTGAQPQASPTESTASSTPGVPGGIMFGPEGAMFGMATGGETPPGQAPANPLGMLLQQMMGGFAAAVQQGQQTPPSSASARSGASFPGPQINYVPFPVGRGGGGGQGAAAGGQPGGPNPVQVTMDIQMQPNGRPAVPRGTPGMVGARSGIPQSQATVQAAHPVNPRVPMQHLMGILEQSRDAFSRVMSGQAHANATHPRHVPVTGAALASEIVPMAGQLLRLIPQLERLASLLSAESSMPEAGLRAETQRLAQQIGHAMVHLSPWIAFLAPILTNTSLGASPGDISFASDGAQPPQPPADGAGREPAGAAAPPSAEGSAPAPSPPAPSPPAPSPPAGGESAGADAADAPAAPSTSAPEPAPPKDSNASPAAAPASSSSARPQPAAPGPRLVRVNVVPPFVREAMERRHPLSFELQARSGRLRELLARNRGSQPPESDVAEIADIRRRIAEITAELRRVFGGSARPAAPVPGAAPGGAAGLSSRLENVRRRLANNPRANRILQRAVEARNQRSPSDASAEGDSNGNGSAASVTAPPDPVGAAADPAQSMLSAIAAMLGPAGLGDDANPTLAAIMGATGEEAPDDSKLTGCLARNFMEAVHLQDVVGALTGLGAVTGIPHNAFVRVRQALSSKFFPEGFSGTKCRKLLAREIAGVVNDKDFIAELTELVKPESPSDLIDRLGKVLLRHLYLIIALVHASNANSIEVAGGSATDERLREYLVLLGSDWGDAAEVPAVPAGASVHNALLGYVLVSLIGSVVEAYADLARPRGLAYAVDRVVGLVAAWMEKDSSGSSSSSAASFPPGVSAHIVSMAVRRSWASHQAAPARHPPGTAAFGAPAARDVAAFDRAMARAAQLADPAWEATIREDVREMARGGGGPPAPGSGLLRQRGAAGQAAAKKRRTEDAAPAASRVWRMVAAAVPRASSADAEETDPRSVPDALAQAAANVIRQEVAKRAGGSG